MSIEALKTTDEPAAIEIKLQDASADIWDKKISMVTRWTKPSTPLIVELHEHWLM